MPGAAKASTTDAHVAAPALLILRSWWEKQQEDASGGRIASGALIAAVTAALVAGQCVQCDAAQARQHIDGLHRIRSIAERRF